MMSVNVTSFIVLSTLTVFISSQGDSMIGPGLWRVLSVEPCAGEFPARIGVARRKINRTHDGFNVNIDYTDDIDDSYAVRVDVCKYVDGGCKPYQTLADESLARFVRKYAADNARAFLELAGVSPPDFPVPRSLEVAGFVFNYAELPRDGIYGEFAGEARVLRAGADVACVLLHTQFSEDDDGR